MKYKNKRDDEDFESDDLNDSNTDYISDEIDNDDNDDISSIEIDFDDEDFDDVIEIREDDLNIDDDILPTSDIDDIIINKHKVAEKHSLEYDTIFKGKKETNLSDDYMDSFSDYYKETIEVDKSSRYYVESIENESYIRNKLLTDRVYEILADKTDVNFSNNRRKPSKEHFNKYFNILKMNLVDESFSNIEIFHELSVYFSDNTLNMFKLLEGKWRNLIFKELGDHIGKSKTSKEIRNRNIYEGTELEFIWEDEYGNEKFITGVVKETDYDNSSYMVDSFENIYQVNLSDVTKILNNEKFKYNLNKLNNIDFI